MTPDRPLPLDVTQAILDLSVAAMKWGLKLRAVDFAMEREPFVEEFSLHTPGPSVKVKVER